jgi:hypothetical protein
VLLQLERATEKHRAATYPTAASEWYQTAAYVPPPASAIVTVTTPVGLEPPVDGEAVETDKVTNLNIGDPALVYESAQVAHPVVEPLRELLVVEERDGRRASA